ncbi:hypothetical protein ACFLVS_02225 [Chloroflexota bacterium]
MLRYLKPLAIFVLGLSSPIIVHIANIIYSLILPSHDGGAVMSGILTSMPWNILAFIGFFGALAFLLWYGRQQGNREKLKETETERQEELKEIETKLQKEQIVNLLKTMAKKMGIDPDKL